MKNPSLLNTREISHYDTNDGSFIHSTQRQNWHRNPDAEHTLERENVPQEKGSSLGAVALSCQGEKIALDPTKLFTSPVNGD